MPKPNILLIMTDQQSAAAMSCAGNPWLKTPAIDSLAARGIRFERAYCGNPICVPSRTSIFTGRFSHETGIDTNAMTPIDFPCVGSLIRKAGYTTAYFGKWHVPHSLSDLAWSGFETTGALDDNAPDEKILEPAVTFLRTMKDKPFFMVASYMNPHDICEYARRLAGMEQILKNGELPEAPPPEECPPLPDNFLPPNEEPEAIRIHQTRPEQKLVYPGAHFTKDQWRSYLWAYHRLVEKVDAKIAALLEVLRETGHDRDTAVLFTSDHGDGMAAHGWNQKTLFYEEVSRVPFILSMPGENASASVDRQSLIQTGTDIAATLFDLAGVELPSDLKGVSALRVAESGRSFIVSENHLARQAKIRAEVSGRMLRSSRYKYVCYDGGKNPEQLFDMDADPGEMKSLVSDPASAATLREHRALLRDHLRDTGDSFQMPSLAN